MQTLVGKTSSLIPTWDWKMKFCLGFVWVIIRVKVMMVFHSKGWCENLTHVSQEEWNGQDSAEVDPTVEMWSRYFGWGCRWSESAVLLYGYKFSRAKKFRGFGGSVMKPRILSSKFLPLNFFNHTYCAYTVCGASCQHNVYFAQLLCHYGSLPIFTSFREI